MLTQYEIQRNFSGNLKRLRKLKGYTQETVARKLYITRAALGAYEEYRAMPNIENLIRIANILNVSFLDMISKELAKEIEPYKVKKPIELFLL